MTKARSSNLGINEINLEKSKKIKAKRAEKNYFFRGF